MNPCTDIIITYRATRTFPTEEYLTNCVNSIYQHTHQFRIIIVDDNSDEIGRKAAEQCAAMSPDNLLVRTHKQHWFTRAVNLGLRFVRTPYAVVLNSDTVTDTGWLEELYNVMQEVESTVGRVGLVGSIQSTEEPRRYEVLSKPQDYVTGHAWLLSMAAIFEASAARGTPGIYLDELNVGAAHIHSDVHICWSLIGLNWQCVKAFKSNVGHLGARSWGQALGLLPRSLDEVNYHYQP